jgi:hypothetical protein
MMLGQRNGLRMETFFNCSHLDIPWHANSGGAFSLLPLLYFVTITVLGTCINMAHGFTLLEHPLEALQGEIGVLPGKPFLRLFNPNLHSEVLQLTLKSGILILIMPANFYTICVTNILPFIELK